jgi:hypothetical protein
VLAMTEIIKVLVRGTNIRLVAREFYEVDKSLSYIHTCKKKKLFAQGALATERVQDGTIS